MKVKNKKKSSNLKPTRKQLRKQQRKDKKARRNEYYTNRQKPGELVKPPLKDSPKKNNPTSVKTVSKTPEKPKTDGTLSVEQSREKEKLQQMKLQKEMNKQRKSQLKQANFEEDRNIKRLEKQLKLKKRQSKSIPKSFAVDGLDYLLEVCDSENMESAISAEQQLLEGNDDFEEDFALMTKVPEAKLDSQHEIQASDEESISDSEFSGLSDEETSSFKGGKKRKLASAVKDNSKKVKLDADEDSGDDFNSDFGEDLSGDDSVEEDLEDPIDKEEDLKESIDKEEVLEDPADKEETWEDIYGRLRAKDGSVVTKSEDKYVPPAMRLEAEDSTDKNRIEQLSRLRRQIKGLLNRLAESNMYTISTQIEDLYMRNSRNDMNNTITSLILESLVTNVVAPERLLIEHVVLITVLHANVGTEVGAHFLQTVVKQFHENINNDVVSENKALDNVVLIISQLYNFKLFDSKLIFEMLRKLAEKFEEKHVECVLHILKAVGFNLRKDDPIALKALILDLQKQAAAAPDSLKNNARVKFMLDILLAIKNNNVLKIPNYDTSYPEHLKKVMKGFIRKGNYVTQLNISIEDLLNAEERGRWWVVGSAWKGNVAETPEKSQEKGEMFSEKLLELARKQRMNTDARRNIFCILMSSEDYLDAFEKLLRLGLKNQQEQEIVHVILHCCLQEKHYNPFYAILCQKFCDYNRKYQMTTKYAVWDKIKTLKESSGTKISSLAKLLGHLLINKGLPLSVLKVVQFSDLDKISLRFIRQILLNILLHDDLQMCLQVFLNVAKSDKLKMFRESLRLFIRHFLLRNLKTDKLVEKQKVLLQERGKMVDKMLKWKEKRID